MWQNDAKIIAWQRERQRLGAMISDRVWWLERRATARAYVQKFDPDYRETALRQHYDLPPLPPRRWKS